MERVCSLTPSEIIEFRETVLSQLEKASERIRACGASDAWYGDADSLLRGVVGSSNGFLFEQLIKAVGHEDVECANLLRYGAQMLGELVASGIGAPCESGEVKSSGELWRKHVAHNKSLCKRLLAERDANPEAQRRCDRSVHEATLKDATLGRMSQPGPLDKDLAEGTLLQPRFGVEQVQIYL